MSSDRESNEGERQDGSNSAGQVSGDTGTRALSARTDAAAELARAEQVDRTLARGRKPGESRLEFLGRRAWALVGIGLVLWGILHVIDRISVILVPFLVAAVLVIIGNPIVGRLESRGVPRAVGTTLYFLTVLVVAATFVMILIPPFTSQIRLFAQETPKYVERGNEFLERLQERFDASSPGAGEALQAARHAAEQKSQELAGSVAGGVFGTARAILGLLAAILIGSIIGFMVVADFPRLSRPFTEWMAIDKNKRAAGMLRSMRRSFVWYVRGQLISALCTAILVTVALMILDVPFYLPLGALAGLAHLIPGVGPFIAAIPTVLIAFTSGGWVKATLVTLVTVAILQLVAYVIGPRILGKAVELHPLSIILALTIGGIFFGITGVLLAVPVVAAARDAIRWSLYTDEEVDAAILAEVDGVDREIPAIAE